MKINICMLLGYRYNPKMQIPPDVKIPSYITNFGHDVTWILSSEEIKETLETSFNAVHIFVVPCKYSKGFLHIFSIVLYALRRKKNVSKNFKQKKYNMVFVRGYVFDGLLALYLKRRYKVPFVFEMENPIEQSYETHKFYSKHKYFWYFISKIESHLRIYLLRKADLVLPVGRFMEAYLAKKGIERSKMMNLPHGVNLNRFLNASGGAIRKRYRLEHSSVIIYVGTMDKLRHLNVLIHALSKIKEREKNIKLLMVGDGTDKTNLEKLADDLGIRNDVVFTGQVLQSEVPNFIAAADIAVSAVPPLDFYKVSCPIKMIEYMGVGKPVVANEEIPEQKEVIGENGGGILVKFEAESFANGIIKLIDDPKLAKEMGAKGREWVVKNRSYEILARKVEKKYFEVLKSDLMRYNQK